MKFADLAECQAVVDIIINSVNTLDPIHLTSLKETVTTTLPTLRSQAHLQVAPANVSAP
jgi:hypothetical protein